MATLVFDIETIGEDWDALDAVTQESLLRWVRRTARTETEVAAGTADVKSNLRFSPVTGRIVAVGLYDKERAAGVVYYVGETFDDTDETTGFRLKGRTEAELLKDFWEGAHDYDTFVSFNGRRFDVPFLLHRSVVAGVKPTVELMGSRYLQPQQAIRHVDLQDQLTFYGAMQRQPSLHLFCRSYGITSPKQEMGGDDVAELFQQKQFRDIARYNARDVIATDALYEKWLSYLAPTWFLNTAIA